MPVMSPADLLEFLKEHFPQAAHLGLAIDHLDDEKILHKLHLTPGEIDDVVAFLESLNEQ